MQSSEQQHVGSSHSRELGSSFICARPGCNRPCHSLHALKCHQRSGLCKGFGSLAVSRIPNKHIVGGGLSNGPVPRFINKVSLSSVFIRRHTTSLAPRPSYDPQHDADDVACQDQDTPTTPDMGQGLNAEWPPMLLLLSGPQYICDGALSRDALRAEPGKHFLSFTDRLTSSQAQQLAAMKHKQQDSDVATTTSRPKRLYLDEHDRQVKVARAKVGNKDSQRAVVRWITDARVSEEMATSLLSMLSHPCFSADHIQTSSFRELKAMCSEVMPDLVGSQSDVLQIRGNKGQLVTLKYSNQQNVEFHYHNLWEQSLLLFRNPRFQGKMYLKSQPQFLSPHDPTSPRVYNTFASGLLYQAMCEYAKPGHIVLAPCLYSDESSMPFPNMTAYPIYCEFHFPPGQLIRDHIKNNIESHYYEL